MTDAGHPMDKTSHLPTKLLVYQEPMEKELSGRTRSVLQRNSAAAVFPSFQRAMAWMKPGLQLLCSPFTLPQIWGAFLWGSTAIWVAFHFLPGPFRSVLTNRMSRGMIL